MLKAFSKNEYLNSVAKERYEHELKIPILISHMKCGIWKDQSTQSFDNPD